MMVCPGESRAESACPPWPPGVEIAAVSGSPCDLSQSPEPLCASEDPVSAAVLDGAGSSCVILGTAWVLKMWLTDSSDVVDVPNSS